MMVKARNRGLSDSFNARLFIRTLSYRDFLTPLSLGLLLLAMFQIVGYYGGEHWVENNILLIRSTLMASMIFLNHIVYRLEHRRPNNYIGRSIHTSIFLICFVSLYQLYFFLIGLSHFGGMDPGIIGMLLMLVVFVMLFELIVALVKRILNLFKWQIL